MIIDAHCDTLSTGRNLLSNSGHLDIDRAIRAGYSGQVFAAFGHRRMEQLRRLESFTKPEGFAVIPAVEGADEVEGLSDLNEYSRLGVKLLGLTWNNDNALAGGCGGTCRGLTGFGGEAVAECESLGIIVDLSHSSAQTFEDVIAAREKPVVVTHACCAELVPHRRNLTDNQLRAVANSGGVVGICYYSQFLTGSGLATLKDVVKHIAHAVNIAGSEHVGLGSDFDGCELLPEGMDGVQSVPELLELLPFPDDIVDRIAGGNWQRLLL